MLHCKTTPALTNHLLTSQVGQLGEGFDLPTISVVCIFKVFRR